MAVSKSRPLDKYLHRRHFRQAAKKRHAQSPLATPRREIASSLEGFRRQRQIRRTIAGMERKPAVDEATGKRKTPSEARIRKHGHGRETEVQKRVKGFQKKLQGLTRDEAIRLKAMRHPKTGKAAARYEHVSQRIKKLPPLTKLAGFSAPVKAKKGLARKQKKVIPTNPPKVSAAVWQKHHQQVSQRAKQWEAARKISKKPPAQLRQTLQRAESISRSSGVRGYKPAQKSQSVLRTKKAGSVAASHKAFDYAMRHRTVPREPVSKNPAQQLAGKLASASTRLASAKVNKTGRRTAVRQVRKKLAAQEARRRKKYVPPGYGKVNQPGRKNLKRRRRKWLAEKETTRRKWIASHPKEVAYWQGRRERKRKKKARS